MPGPRRACGATQNPLQGLTAGLARGAPARQSAGCRDSMVKKQKKSRGDIQRSGKALREARMAPEAQGTPGGHGPKTAGLAPSHQQPQPDRGCKLTAPPRTLSAA